MADAPTNVFGGRCNWASVSLSSRVPLTRLSRIRAFFVHPDHARQGIGRLIIKACEEAARQAGFRKLELAATLPGEPMYAASGYRVVERFETVLPDKVHLALSRMEKELE